MDKTIIVAFTPWSTYARCSVWQWDTGINLCIQGLELTEAPLVHWGRLNESTAMVTESTLEDGVVVCRIPDELLGQEVTCNYCVDAWVYVTAEDAGRTIRAVQVTVKARKKPDSYVITPTDAKTWDTIEAEAAAAQKAAAEALEAAESVQSIAEDAQAAAAGAQTAATAAQEAADGKADGMTYDNSTLSLLSGETVLSEVEIKTELPTIDTELSSESENAVQNKVITEALDKKLNAVFDGYAANRLLHTNADKKITYENFGGEYYAIMMLGSLDELKDKAFSYPDSKCFIISRASDDSSDSVPDGLNYPLVIFFGKPYNRILYHLTGFDKSGKLLSGYYADGSVRQVVLKRSNPIDEELSDSSENPVQSKTIKAALDTKQDVGLLVTISQIGDSFSIDKDYDTIVNTAAAGNLVFAMTDGSLSDKPNMCLSFHSITNEGVISFIGRYNYEDGYYTDTLFYIVSDTDMGFYDIADVELSDVSIRPVQNRAVKAALDGKADRSEIPEVPVQSVNKKTGAVTLTASDVNALPWSGYSNEYIGKLLGVNGQRGVVPVSVVSKVNGNTGEVTLTASDVGALPDTTVIPTVPESLKNPNALTITVGENTYTYDGSTAINITLPDGTEVAY